MVLFSWLFQSSRCCCSNPPSIPAGFCWYHSVTNTTNSSNSGEEILSYLISSFNFALATPHQDVFLELGGRRGIDFLKIAVFFSSCVMPRLGINCVGSTAWCRHGWGWGCSNSDTAQQGPCWKSQCIFS